MRLSSLARAAASLFLSLGGCALRATTPLPPASLHQDVVFTVSTPLSRTLETSRRALTPLTFLAVQQALPTAPRALREQPVDLTQERFTLSVPGGAPPAKGYGLLVFVAPWPEPTLPLSWQPALSRHGLIFVAATNSGNEWTVLDRRLPLALLAYENVRTQYPLDPERIYIAGLSGGSRAALITALAYPDVFRGALLNAGSEPIGGEEGIYLPPADLFRRFQETRLVYVTGQEDEVNQHDDLISRASMKDWCVFNVEVQMARRIAHQSLDAYSWGRALDALDQSLAVNADALAECNARIQRELASNLADARATIARGQRSSAIAKLKAIDWHYAGLAAPEILELNAELARATR